MRKTNPTLEKQMHHSSATWDVRFVFCCLGATSSSNGAVPSITHCPHDRTLPMLMSPSKTRLELLQVLLVMAR